MTVDLKWRDALTVLCIARAFSREQQGAGWPQVMTPAQLAAVQRPYASGDAQGQRAMWALREALQADCQSQVFTCAVRVERVLISPARDCVPNSTTQKWPSAYTRDGVLYAYTQPAQYGEQTAYLVTAADFAAWLQMHSIVPSQHVQAWCLACAVGDAGSASNALDATDVRDIASLVQYRRQFADLAVQQRPQWLAAHVALVSEWLQQEHTAGRSRGALQRLAVDMGMSRQGLQSVLEKHAQKEASPFGALVGASRIAR